MNKAQIFKAIAIITIFFAFAVLINFGFEMETVRVWRMDGERAKANALVFNRVILLGSLAIASFISLRISEVLSGAKTNLAAYDRTITS